jgi:hypothetical protein
MSPRLTATTLLVLVACSTPQERCISGVTRDLRVVTDLISQSEINIARGYGTQDVTVFTPVWQPCGSGAVVQQTDGTGQLVWVPQMCWENQASTVSRPVAIDLAAERVKLDQLKQQQARLSKQAAPAVAQCRSLYPE